MGVGQRTAPWVELTGGTLEDGDISERQSTHASRDAYRGGLSDWGLLFGLTAMMTIPFALVAWLMS